MPAADVEQAPLGDVRADQVEQAVRGRAAARLLAEVVVVAHVAVEVVQLRALGQERLLDGPALDAGEQVAVPADGVGGRRQRRGRHGHAFALHLQLEIA